jgi:hypothetical protein
MKSARAGSSTPRGAFVLVVAAGLLLLAAAPEAGAQTRFGIAVFGGFNGHSMDDVNEFIEAVNDSVLGGTGFAMDQVKDSWSYGAGVRIRPSGDKLMIALDYERLMAQSELDVFSGSVELDVPASAFTGTAFYFFPSTSRARFGLGAGIGYYTSSGSFGAEDSGVGFEVDVEGSGVGFHGLGAVDVALSPAVHLEGAAGYRFAETSDLEIAEEKVYTPDGDEASIDWSGFMSRLGLTFYFGPGAGSP